MQQGQGDWLEELSQACSQGIEECRQAAARLLQQACPDKTLCEQPVGRRRGKLLQRYMWIEQLIKQGVPDGRSRLILYVISRYLVNVKNLEPEEAHLEIKQFIENSCKNYGNCTKIYDSWIRNVLRKVKEGGWLPWTLERVKERDPQLYDIIQTIINSQ